MPQLALAEQVEGRVFVGELGNRIRPSALNGLRLPMVRPMYIGKKQIPALINFVSEKPGNFVGMERRRNAKKGIENSAQLNPLSLLNYE